MRHGAGAGLLPAIEHSPLAEAMRGELWLYPIVEIVHIAGIVMLVGPVLMFDLRLLGVSSGISVRALAGYLLPWSLAALALIVPTGLMMFSAHPTDFVDNPAFLTKLGLIGIAATNAALFHVGVFRGASDWDSNRPAPLTARLHALLSLTLWFAVIACGRLIAYV